MATPKSNQILLKTELLNKESTLDFLSDGSSGIGYIRKKQQMLPLRVESKSQTRFADQFVLAHSNVPVARLKSLADAQFLSAISEEMSRMRINKINHIQTYAWPHMLRNNSLFIINSSKSGKTWSYLPALCSNTYYDKNILEPSYGPIAIVLVASSKHVEQIIYNCKFLLSSLGNKAPSIVSSFGFRTFVETKVQLLNSCGILVITPSNLLRIFKDNKNEPLIDAKRLQRIIIDDMDLLLIRARGDFESALQALFKLCKRTKANTILPQIVVTSREWNPFLVDIIRLSNQPLLLFGDFLEATVYGRAQLSIKLSSNLKKNESLRRYLTMCKDSISKQIRTMIICNENDEVGPIVKFLCEFDYPSIGYINPFTNNERLVADEWKRKMSNQILVCTDAALPELKIQNVNNLIHYSMPSSWTQFTTRFSALALTYDNITCKPLDRSLAIKDEISQARSLILLDESNGEQMPRLVRFMQKHNQAVHSDIEAVAKHIMIASDQTRFRRGVPMCSQILEFGECDEPNCGDRHEIISFDAVTEKDDIPTNGDIRIHVLKVYSPTHYIARLLEHKPLKSSKWLEVRRSRKALNFNIKLDLHYGDPINLMQHWPLKSDDVCIYKYLHNYRRVRILHVSTLLKNSQASLSVTLKLIDDGFTITGVRSNEIFKCHDDFKNFPHQAIEIRLMNVVPHDNERLWDSNATKEVRKWIMDDIKSNNMIEVKVNFAFANTIWIDNLFVMEKLKGIETDTRLMNLKKSLNQKRFASSKTDNGRCMRTIIDEYGLLNLNTIAPENETDSDISFHSCESENSDDLSFSSAYSDEFVFGMESSKNLERNAEEIKSNTNKLPTDYKQEVNEVKQRYAYELLFLFYLSLIILQASKPESSNKNKECWSEMSLNELFMVEIGDEDENGDWENIFLQLTGKMSMKKFHQLSELISRHIENLNASNSDNVVKLCKLQPLVPLLNCIVKYNNMYLRAKVHEIDEGFYKFFLCDYAFFTSVKAENLFEDFFYPTSEEIVHFTPYQAVHCSLAGIQWNSLCKRYKVTKDFLYACPVQENSIQSNKWINFPINSYKILLYECGMENDFKQASMFNKVLLDNGIALHDPETRHFLELEIMYDDSGPNEMETNLSNNNITTIEELLEQLENCEDMDVVNVEEFFKTAMSFEEPKLELKSINETNDLEENAREDNEQSTFELQNESVECCMPGLENLYKRPETTWYQTDYLIYLSMHVPDITDYYLKVSKDNVRFAAFVNCVEYNLIIDLLGTVIPQLVCHELRGLNVTVILVKSLCMEWPRLLRNPGKFIWLTYNYNSFDDKSFDKVTSQQYIQNALGAAKETLTQEETDSDNDSELDLFQTYNYVEKDDLDLC
ncbi:putative ATP-dependent RNA helicase TDRD12 isoform 1-T1 [Glossina fuscipes fuscipes]